mgnify:CR=1 FL=1
MNLAHWLARRSKEDPFRPALFSGRTLVSDYGGFDMQARAVASWLLGQGVGPGDRVAIFMKNIPDYLVVLFGIWYAGAAAVPVNAKLHGREADYILDDADAKIVFASASQGASLSGGRPVISVPGDAYRAILRSDPVAEIAPRDTAELAWLFYTSGTTGKTKGVIITHGMLLSMALCYRADVDQVLSTDAALYAAPLSHGAGLYTLMHVQAGARHVCPVSGGFDVAEIMELASHFTGVHMFAAPTMVKRLTDGAKAAGWDGSGLRTVVYGGGPMYNADIIQAVDQFGAVFVQIYGQGECPMGITALPPEWGEVIVAFVVGTAPEAELDALCLAQIARFKRPKEYIRLPELPKNNYGKVLKTELRKLLG